VFFDSGIRTGSDIIKALALGAQGIFRAYFLIKATEISGLIVWRVQWEDHGYTVSR
jgi:isopentenyl diphosphate isomerase/L-lactate dehydrogenase-like FMN-dependent dehydrogenase